MNCKNLRIRSKNYKKYGYCIKYKKEVPIYCKECEQIEYKVVKPIKKRTSKQTKAETKRYSIFSVIFSSSHYNYKLQFATCQLFLHFATIFVAF